MVPPSVDDAVQATAFIAAACRAEETRQPRPRLIDPLAELFVAASSAPDEYGAADQPGSDHARAGSDHARAGSDHARAGSGRALLAAGRDEVVARTLLIDQLLLSAVAHRPPVVVNLGAGFCTRPYRLDLSGCRLLVEFDAAPVLALKERLLATERPTCPVRRITVDLRDTDALTRAVGSAELPDGPVVVLTEGVLVYLPEPELRRLATALAATPAVSHWLADLISTESAGGMNVLATRANAGVTLHGLASLAPIEEAGWVAAEYRPLPTVRSSVRTAQGARGRWAGPPRPAAASRQIVDGVVAFRRPD